MSAILWVPLAVAVVWLIIVRASGRLVPAVRIVGGAVACVELLASLVALVATLEAPPVGAVAFGAIFGVGAMVSLAGLVGVVRWVGRQALILRWVGLGFVMVMLSLGGGMLALAAGLFYAPVLQPAEAAAG
jgi:hypothetical protein